MRGEMDHTHKFAVHSPDRWRRARAVQGQDKAFRETIALKGGNSVSSYEFSKSTGWYTYYSNQ